MSDAGRDAVALVQAALDHDDEALALLLDHGDNRAQASMLAALAAWLAGRFGQENVPVLIGGLRKATLGQPVRLLSDGLHLSEERT